MVKNPHCQHACTHVPLGGCTAAVQQEDKDKKDPKQGPGNGSPPGPGGNGPKDGGSPGGSPPGSNQPRPPTGGGSGGGSGSSKYKKDSNKGDASKQVKTTPMGGSAPPIVGSTTDQDEVQLKTLLDRVQIDHTNVSMVSDPQAPNLSLNRPMSGLERWKPVGDSTPSQLSVGGTVLPTLVTLAMMKKPPNLLITSSNDVLEPFEIVHCTPTEAEVIINPTPAERAEKHEAPDTLEEENIAKRLCSSTTKTSRSTVKLRDIMQIPTGGTPKMELPDLAHEESFSQAPIVKPEKKTRPSCTGSDSTFRIDYALLEPIIDQLWSVDSEWVKTY